MECSPKLLRYEHEHDLYLAIALKIPESYLDAAIAGKSVEAIAILQFCPQCWTPGTQPEAQWGDPRAKFCFLCGTRLIRECPDCGSAIEKYQHKFCPNCGKQYRNTGL